MLNVELPIKLHQNQRAIFDSKALNIVVKAGKRFGKSELAIYKVLKAAGMKPGGTFWYIAPYYSHAEGIAWQRFKEMIPESLIKHRLENKLSIELVNGSKIILKGADNQVSLRGPKLDGVVLDEAAYMDRYIWNNILRGQLLGVNGEAPGFAFFISSPINPLQTIGKNISDWFAKFYQEALRKKQSGDESWDAFHFNIYDNPLLSREQIAEIEADTTEDEFRVEYLALDSAHATQVYSEFDYKKHVGEPQGNAVSLLVRGVDWGIDHPTVCLFVQVDVPKKLIYIEDEYVQSGFTIEESAEVIKRKTGNRVVDWTVCDPSLNKRNSQTKRTDKQEFDRLGIYCVAGDNNHRGYNITKMFLKKDMIKIHPKCKTLINQLKNLQWADKTGDDTTDCLRYVCVRLHDLVFNGIFDREKKTEKEEPFKLSLLDRNLFPKRNFEGNTVKEQVQAY